MRRVGGVAGCLRKVTRQQCCERSQGEGDRKVTLGMGWIM